MGYIILDKNWERVCFSFRRILPLLGKYKMCIFLSFNSYIHDRIFQMTLLGRLNGFEHLLKIILMFLGGSG